MLYGGGGGGRKESARGSETEDIVYLDSRQFVGKSEEEENEEKGPREKSGGEYVDALGAKANKCRTLYSE